MRLACFLVTLAASSAAQSTAVRAGVLLKTSLDGQAIVLKEVYLNGAGPFRMLVDTGNASSMVRPEIARRLSLKPAYSVEMASGGGVRRLAAAILDEVRAGAVYDRAVEVMIGNVPQAGVDGVLGDSWLVRHDYLLDYRNRRMVLDGPAAGTGIRVPLRSTDGRPAVSVAIDGRAADLVVDSGASSLILFEKPASGAALSAFDTDGGTARGQGCKVHLSLGGARERLMEAFRIDAHGLGSGLLPASVFAGVYVSNREGFVEFMR